MYKFAVIEYGVVQNVIIAESAEIAEAVTGKTAVFAEDFGIGDLYDEATGTFSRPPVDGEITEEAIDAILAQEESNTP